MCKGLVTISIESNFWDEEKASDTRLELYKENSLSILKAVIHVLSDFTNIPVEGLIYSFVEKVIMCMALSLVKP